MSCTEDNIVYNLWIAIPVQIILWMVRGGIIWLLIKVITFFILSTALLFAADTPTDSVSHYSLTYKLGTNIMPEADDPLNNWLFAATLDYYISSYGFSIGYNWFKIYDYNTFSFFEMGIKKFIINKLYIYGNYLYDFMPVATSIWGINLGAYATKEFLIQIGYHRMSGIYKAEFIALRFGLRFM